MRKIYNIIFFNSIYDILKDKRSLEEIIEEQIENDSILVQDPSDSVIECFSKEQLGYIQHNFNVEYSCLDFSDTKVLFLDVCTNILIFDYTRIFVCGLNIKQILSNLIEYDVKLANNTLSFKRASILNGIRFEYQDKFLRLFTVVYNNRVTLIVNNEAIFSFKDSLSKKDMLSLIQVTRSKSGFDLIFSILDDIRFGIRLDLDLNIINFVGTSEIVMDIYNSSYNFLLTKAKLLGG